MFAIRRFKNPVVVQFTRMDISASLYMPLIKVNWKLQQSNPGRVAKDTKTPGLKVWVTPPGKKKEDLLRYSLQVEEIQNG